MIRGEEGREGGREGERRGVEEGKALRPLGAWGEGT